MWVFVGVSERGAPPANTNQVILYVAVAHTYMYIHTPRLPPNLPSSRASRPSVYLSVSVHPLPTTTYRKSGRNECAATHDRSRILFDATGSFTPFRSFAKNKANASSLFFMKTETRYFSPRSVRNFKPKFPRIYTPPMYPAYVFAITTITIGNCRRRAESPPPFTSAKLSGLIARKIRPDFET